MNKYIFIFFIICCGCLVGCREEELVLTAREEKTKPQESQTEEDAPVDNPDTEKTSQYIYVYVCGHVNQPGVYAVLADARICDALEQAGGVTSDAMPEKLPQAEHMVDGQTLYVPGEGDELSVDVEDGDDRIDLNSADKEQLMTLPGIGESKADLILQYRKEHGAFKQIEDLMDIPGIKEGVFNKIKERIKVSQ